MGNLLKRYAGTHYYYDGLGNPQRRIAPNGETWHYQYDAEHRLIEACRFDHGRSGLGMAIEIFVASVSLG